MRFTLEEILGGSGATPVFWPGPLDSIGVATSREGELAGRLFFPIRRPGPWEELFRHLAAAGAAGVVLWPGQVPPSPERYPGLGTLRADSPVEAFFRLATAVRARSGSLVVGITGTSGKTSVKEALRVVLAGRYKVAATAESENLVTNCAELILDMGGGPGEVAVIEMGFGQKGDIERMAAIAQPDVGLITKVTPAHLDGADQMWEVVAREKGRLGFHIRPGGALLLHAEDAGCALLSRSSYPVPIRTFGEGPTADLRYGDLALGEWGSRFRLVYRGDEAEVNVQACGSIQAPNGAAAALIACHLGLSLAEAAERLGQVPPVPQRFQIHRFSRQLTVVDDTYNATPDALAQGLANAARLAGGRRKVAFLGSIAKLGEQGEALNREAGLTAAAHGFHQAVLLAGEHTGAIRAGLLAGGVPPGAVQLIDSYQAIPAALLSAVGPGTLLYAKALYSGGRIAEFLDRLAALGYERLPASVGGGGTGS